MKKILFLLLLLFPSIALSCMPPFPGEVMVGRINSVTESASGMMWVDFSSYQFPFRTYEHENPTSWHWQSYLDTVYPVSIKSGALVIVLSDYQDGSYPTNYSIFHITTLSCENNMIKLGKKYGTVIGWNRKKGSCNYQANSLLDVFIEGDEKKWLQALRDKYPTCDSLERAFPIQEEIIKTAINIPSLENDVVIYHSPYPWFGWILKKIDTFLSFFNIFLVYV